MSKLTSRKFLLALAAAASVFASEAFGLAIAPETIYGIAAIVAAYVFGEGMVDRKAVEATAKQVNLDALDTATLYARQLEAQIQAMQMMNAGEPTIGPASDV